MRCSLPSVTQFEPTIRKLSNQNDTASQSTSSSSLDAKKEIVKDSSMKEEPGIASSVSSTTTSTNAKNLEFQQSKSQKAIPSPPESSTITSISASSPSSTTPQTLTSASNTSTSRTESETDIPYIPSKGGIPAPSISPKETVVIEEGFLTQKYDKVFRLWSERSGASEMLALKESVNEAGAAFDTVSAVVTTNRRNLDDALRKWERASGHHLHLLQRRESWTPEDAQRFADFVSLEITSRAELEQARHDLGRSEELLTKSQLDYINKMRRRYHEEQIWQDQWRVLGTYGTWTLIVLNSCVFLGSQFFQRGREQKRIETIERLIRDSRSYKMQTEEHNAEVKLEKSEIPASVGATEDTMDTNDAIRKDKRVEDKNTANGEDELKSVESPGIEQIDAVETKSFREENQKPNRWYPAIERIGTMFASVGSFVNRWEHKVRSSAKELAGSASQKLHLALPANIANEIPKSASEIHVPSAVIGASVGCIAALTISVIFSALSNRRY